MNKKEIENMQNKLIDWYPKLNRGGCWLFAYCFVSRVWWVWLRLWWEKISDFNNKLSQLACNHVLVKYNDIVFDWHSFYEESECNIIQEVNKMELATMILESWWNSEFYSSLYCNNFGEWMFKFMFDFESILDTLDVEYNSYL